MAALVTAMYSVEFGPDLDAPRRLMEWLNWLGIELGDAVKKENARLGHDALFDGFRGGEEGARRFLGGALRPHPQPARPRVARQRVHTLHSPR